jgi:3-deoxy-manno-octulosonate cytidylyltransferase (CMP-KDO synthetase)
MPNTTIVIPARYASTRLPGKPLVKIAGQTMLSRVVDIARKASEQSDDVKVMVATDDDRIMAHCQTLGVTAVMTPDTCKTGSDRVLAAIDKLDDKPDFIINLQGDAPLTPPDFIKQMLDAVASNPTIHVVTPVTQLSWAALDKLRLMKQETPFSGTCAILNEKSQALWFSKNIIPAIRNEDARKEESPLSPIFRHIGLYGYSYEALKQFVTWPEAHYEKAEGLEQLRFIENNLPIHAIKVDYNGRPSISGVDSPLDVERTEKLLGAQHD